MADDVLDAMVRDVGDRAARDIASLESLRGMGHEETLAKAIEVMGEGGARWLTHRAMALDAVPAELLAKGGEEGRRLVEEALARIEHGVYA